MNHTEIESIITRLIDSGVTHEDYNRISEATKEIMELIPHWIPIEEAELVPGERYDVFHFIKGYRLPGCRIPDVIYQPGQFITDTVFPVCYSASEVTHVMKLMPNPV